MPAPVASPNSPQAEVLLPAYRASINEDGRLSYASLIAEQSPLKTSAHCTRAPSPRPSCLSRVEKGTGFFLYSKRLLMADLCLMRQAQTGQLIYTANHVLVSNVDNCPACLLQCCPPLGLGFTLTHRAFSHGQTEHVGRPGHPYVHEHHALLCGLVRTLSS